MFDKIINGFVKTFIAENRWKLFLDGFWNTIQIAVVATLIGVAIGAVVAIIRVFNKQTGKLKLLSKICEIYTTIIRGTPLVVQLLITYNIIFAWSTNAVAIGMIGFGLNSGAYVAEIMRGGINAVDIGQTEAGRSLGLSSVTTMKSIVLPQAIKNVLPAIGNEFISLLKETSIIGYLGVIDLTKAADRVISRTMNVYFPYISIALIYLAVVYGLNYLFKRLERRLAKSDR
ncbi:MAG: amino acid ABC transporter permease [Clostridia bacterium]|jgi:His/Glu/Gln/Arg/opine family amino acid ABC transporter permease subunit|nr:amino acid ABC transporter permease [Clostridia bacterium]